MTSARSTPTNPPRHATRWHLLFAALSSVTACAAEPSVVTATAAAAPPATASLAPPASGAPTPPPSPAASPALLGGAPARPQLRPWAWKPPSVDKWRAATTGYASAVVVGNQVPLGPAAVSFARYLNGMHNRIHAHFANEFLAFLDTQPATDPKNDKSLVVRLEIVVAPDGHILRMGVVKASGVLDFDVAALESLDVAQPFGPVPDEIRSVDGNLYLHWELLRDEVYACTTMKARPFRLSSGTPASSSAGSP
jgi:TonB family protein